MVARLPVRHPVAGRRTRISRASSRLTRTRFAAAACLLLASGAFQWLTVASDFALDPGEVHIDGLIHTSTDAALAALDLEERVRPNAFRIRTDALQQALLALPAITRAEVHVVLPDRLLVAVEERRPILVWRAGGTDHLVDVEGVLFATAGPPADPSAGASAEPSAGASAELSADPSAEPSPTDGLPIVEDRRAGAVARLGGRIEPLDLEIVRLLGAVTPEMLRSAAPGLSLTIDDADGFVISASTGWRAVFGRYTPHLRTAALVDDQVQCLRSLLSGQEAEIETVFLSPSAERCGTYRPRDVPAVSEAPEPSREP